MGGAMTSAREKETRGRRPNQAARRTAVAALVVGTALAATACGSPTRDRQSMLMAQATANRSAARSGAAAPGQPGTVGGGGVAAAANQPGAPAGLAQMA